MIDPHIKSPPDESIEAIAARWIARRDRGLDAAEEAAYRKWLGEDPRHEAAMFRPEKNWSALDQLAGKFPAPAGPPDPDLLAPDRRRSLWLWVPLLGAAAAIAFVYFLRPSETGQQTVIAGNPQKAPARVGVVHIEPKRLTLEDGSVVELNSQAQVDVQFTAAERRVRLERGEAYFIVAKNPQRPFVVITDRLTVRAVGTAFSVGLRREDLSVLVTEGTVRLDESPEFPGEKSPAPGGLPNLDAGQRGVVGLAAARRATDRPEITVTQLTPAEIDRALSWRNLQLEFTDMALGEVVAEFNRYNSKKLAMSDAETAAVRVTCTFRADNVDAFVRLLDFSFGVTATPQGDRIVLRKTHGR